MGFEPTTSGIIVEPVMALPLGHSRARDTLRFNNRYDLQKLDKNSRSYATFTAATWDGGCIYDTIPVFLLTEQLV